MAGAALKYDYSAEAKTWPGYVYGTGKSTINYPSGPFAQPNIIGGTDGDAFITTAQVKETPDGGTTTWHMNGAMVEKIEVWKDDKSIQGLRVSYTDKYQTTTYGSSAGTMKSFTFAKGERVIALSLWGNGVGTHLGRIKFATSNDRGFDHGKDTTGQQEFIYSYGQLGSGHPMGFVGKQRGGRIVSLGAVFLLPVDRIEILNVKFEKDTLVPGSTDSIDEVEVDDFEARLENETTTEPWSWKSEKKVTASSSWSLSATLEFEASLSATASFYDIGSVSATASWKVSTTETLSSAVENERTLSWIIDGVLSRDKPVVRCVAMAKRGQLNNEPFTAFVKVYLAGPKGDFYAFQQRGTYKCVKWTKASVTTKYYDLNGNLLR